MAFLYYVAKCKQVKVSSYLMQYPVLITAQSSLYFTFLADLLNQTSSQLLWQTSSHPASNAR